MEKCANCHCECHCDAIECPNCPNDVCIKCDCGKEDNV
jgi:hypothetical protein